MIKYSWVPVVFLVVGCSAEPPGETRREQQSIELDGSASTRLNLEMDAGELKVSGGAAKLMEAEFTYNVDRLKPIVEHHPSATEGEIRISQAEARGFTLGNACRAGTCA